jgi:hypothetical protein
MDTTSTDNEGIIYILTNEAMRGYIQIGKTAASVDQHILELSRSSAVPLPFECYYAARVADMNHVEKVFHDAFGDHRRNQKKEFFMLAPERAVALLRLLAVEEVTPVHAVGVESKEDVIAVEEARKKRSAFNFKMVDIPGGAELTFIRDEHISCTVSRDQKRVIFNGREMSTSEAAAEALGSTWWVQGPAYWTYNGEILDERHMRMEADGESTLEEIEAARDTTIPQPVDGVLGK